MRKELGLYSGPMSKTLFFRKGVDLRPHGSTAS